MLRLPPPPTLSTSEFCRAVLDVLRGERGSDASVRGARAVCEMYHDAAPGHFEIILVQLARGSASSRLAEGARWLLPRWIEASQGHQPHGAVSTRANSALSLHWRRPGEA
jgi:hypothetical protein